MELKINEKPHLRVCKMNCDSKLNDKLEKYELTKFLNSHSINLFLGRPGSGKTSFVYSLFQNKDILKKTFNKIYLFQPSASRSSMDDQLFNQLPENQKFDELDLESLHYVMEEIKHAEKSENHCIIMDDMTAYLKNKDTLQLLKEMIFNRRHLHLSIFFCVQTFYSVPKDIRKLFTNMFIFKINKNEMETIFDEVVEEDKGIITLLCKMVYNKKYEYLFINTDSGRMFKGFDEIIIRNKYL